MISFSSCNSAACFNLFSKRLVSLSADIRGPKRPQSLLLSLAGLLSDVVKGPKRPQSLLFGLLVDAISFFSEVVDV